MFSNQMVLSQLDDDDELQLLEQDSEQSNLRMLKQIVGLFEK